LEFLALFPIPWGQGLASKSERNCCLGFLVRWPLCLGKALGWDLLAMDSIDIELLIRHIAWLTSIGEEVAVWSQKCGSLPRCTCYFP
jgi:hypothetical protein